MSHLLVMDVPFWDKVLRTVAVYAALAVLLRLAGKRDLAQLNTFDLVVMLLLSNVVQNAVIGPDNSLTGGLVGAVVLVVVNAIVVRLAAGSAFLHKLTEGTPTVLARHGRFVAKALRHEGLRKGDLMTELRRQGADGVGEVETATLEPGGSLVVEMKPDLRPATKADLAALTEQLRRLEAKLDAAR